MSMCVFYLFNYFFSFFCVFLVKLFVLSETKFQRCCEGGDCLR